MTGLATLSLLQAPSDLPEMVHRIALAQTVMAVATVVVALVVIGLGLAGVLLMRALRRTVERLERQAERLSPRVEPVLTAASRIADDATDLSRQTRKRAESLLETVERLERDLRRLIDAADERVRRLGAVLDIIQEETEDLLLDATATARGVHASARALKKRPAEAGTRMEEPKGGRNG